MEQALENLRTQLEKDLPPIIAREEIEKYTGGLYKQKTMQNMDCQGKGPKKFKAEGRKICYAKDDLIDWLLVRMQIARGKYDKPSD